MTKLKSVNEAVKTISFEEALTIKSELEDPLFVDTPGVSVWTGYHPNQGDLSIVVSMSGESLLIFPFATRA